MASYNWNLMQNVFHPMINAQKKKKKKKEKKFFKKINLEISLVS